MNVEVAVNNLSFGNVSIAILREMHRRGLTPAVFPIGGQIDMSAQKPDPVFQQWLSGCIQSAPQRYSRKHPTFKLWHIRGSEASLSERGNDLLTFFELDSLTQTEVNILRQQRRVYVTSTFTRSVFSQYGIDAVYVPLGFDSYNFHPLERRPKIDGVTSFLLAGKLEKRKGHLQVLRAWAKKYGNRREYRLNCSLFNPFMRPEDQSAIISRALEGRQYWNINLLPFSATNAEYNQVLQSSDIILCCSGGEGRDLPCFHSTALGAWPVALRAHAYLDYLNDDNAVLISPNGKEPARDGVFFHGESSQINVGNWFTFSDDDFYAGCEEAEKRAKTGLNTAGLRLQEWTYAKTTDLLLAEIGRT